jgi:hypothetical protein
MSIQEVNKLKVGILCKKAASVDTDNTSADIITNLVRIDQETRVVALESFEVLRFREGGVARLQDYITCLEDVAKAVMSRRTVNSALKGKATMKDGLQQMRESEEAMQNALINYWTLNSGRVILS